jgi:NADH dehydrogenase
MRNETSHLRLRGQEPGASTRTHIVVVGAGYAGLGCALQLARKTGSRAQVTLINGSDRLVERIRLHERASGADGHRLALADMVRDTGIQLRIGWAESIDLHQRTVAVGGEAITWDRLVLALGSTVDVDGVPGVRELAHTLDESSARALSLRLPALVAQRARVAIVGGGLTGVEAASELAEAHPELSVVLVTRGDLVPGLSDKTRQHVRARLTRLGVELREHVSVRALRRDMLLTDQGPVACAACVWTTGFVASPLARSAGLATDEHGRVWVDRELRSISHPAVFAAGDLAIHREPAGAPVPMGCKSAFPTGFHVAHNLAAALAGRVERPFLYRTVPFCISLGRADGIVELPPLGATRVVLRGTVAAHIKELICRGTLWALMLERRRASLAHWYRERATPRLPAQVGSGSTSPEITERAGV